MRSGPNLQNIPIRSKQGHCLKALLREFLNQRVSAEDLWKLIDCPCASDVADYSAIEIRLMAHMAEQGLGPYGEKS
jgi:DNA polymerase I-like protein with 3'-5' exonuclease and polymerase domains